MQNRLPEISGTGYQEVHIMSWKSECRNRLIKVIAATATAESKSVQEVWADVNLAFVRKHGKNFDRREATLSEMESACDIADARQQYGRSWD
jgi:hypothetical protein